MTADEAGSFGIDTSGYHGPYPVGIFFSDAAGLRWHRDRDGALDQIRVRGLTPLETYVRDPRDPG